jgi:hypothetical protein
MSSRSRNAVMKDAAMLAALAPSGVDLGQRSTARPSDLCHSDKASAARFGLSVRNRTDGLRRDPPAMPFVWAASRHRHGLDLTQGALLSTHDTADHQTALMTTLNGWTDTGEGPSRSVAVFLNHPTRSMSRELAGLVSARVVTPASQAVAGDVHRIRRQSHGLRAASSRNSGMRWRRSKSASVWKWARTGSHSRRASTTNPAAVRAR